MQAAAYCMCGVCSSIGVKPVGPAWIRARIGSLGPAQRFELDGDSAWQALRQAVVARVAAHAHARMLSSDDLEDLAGEVLVRAAPALIGTSHRIRHQAAFLNKLIANQYRQVLRKNGPVWTSVKDEIVDIARGRRGERGLALWYCDGADLVGLSKWQGTCIVPTNAYLDSLQTIRLGRAVRLRQGLSSHLDTTTLLKALLTYLGTPVPVTHAVSLIFELRRLREVRHVPLDHLLASRADPADSSDIAHEVEALQVVEEIAAACELLDDDRLAVFVLHLEGETARCLMRAARPQLVSRLHALFAIAFPPNGEDALRRLPVPDTQIAALIGRPHLAQRDAQICTSNLRRSAQRRISRAILGTATGTSGSGLQEASNE